MVIKKFAQVEKPSQSIKKIIRIQRFCANIVGADFGDPNFHITIKSLQAPLAITIYIIASIWTIIKRSNEDWTILLEASCMSSSVTQGALKFISGYLTRKDIAAKLQMIEELYAFYETKGTKYFTVLNSNCERLRTACKVMLVFFLLPCVALVSMPLIMYIIEGNRYFIVVMEVPGVDATTLEGYFWTTLVQFYCSYVGVIGLFAGDMLIVIYLLQSFLFVDLMHLKIEELNALVADPENCNNADVSETLIDVAKLHQMYSNYTREVNITMQSVITIGVITSATSIATCLVMMLITDWPGAYPYFLIGVYVLYFLCILGTRTEICNDQFVIEIYNISWYNMTVSQQKIVHRMLLQSQFPQEITVAGVMPLSVSTALQITKTIYSMFMMMIQFLEV